MAVRFGIQRNLQIPPSSFAQTKNGRRFVCHSKKVSYNSMAHIEALRSILSLRKTRPSFESSPMHPGISIFTKEEEEEAEEADAAEEREEEEEEENGGGGKRENEEKGEEKGFVIKEERLVSRRKLHRRNGLAEVLNVRIKFRRHDFVALNFFVSPPVPDFDPAPFSMGALLKFAAHLSLIGGFRIQMKLHISKDKPNHYS